MRPITDFLPTFKGVNKPIVLMLKDSIIYRQCSYSPTKLIYFYPLFTNGVGHGRAIKIEDIGPNPLIWAFESEVEAGGAIALGLTHSINDCLLVKTEPPGEVNLDLLRKLWAEGKYIGTKLSCYDKYNCLAYCPNKVMIKVYGDTIRAYEKDGSSFATQLELLRETLVFDSEFKFWTWMHTQSS